MTPTQIAAIKGMLAYFDSGNNIPVDKAVIKGNCAEVAALRAALAEPAPEPINFDAAFDAVNWDEWRHQPVRELVRELHRVTAPVREPAPVQEPVAYVANGGYRSSACMKSPGEYGRMEGWEKKYYQPLFIAPQPAPVREPLLAALKEVAETFGEDWREGSTQRKLGDLARKAIAEAESGAV